MGVCDELLREWCGKLLELQVKDMDNSCLDGGILCPACAGMHGRCLDAVYPFLYLADKDGDERYKDGAVRLFWWAEHTVSRPDGSYVNDTNSEWKGTTVFSIIQLAEALIHHGHVLDEGSRGAFLYRIARGADFLYGFEEFLVCNINYRMTCGLALELCGQLLGEVRYQEKAARLIDSAMGNLSRRGILYGEGRPVDGQSPKGCRPVDIGYNVEESLPALMQYISLSGREELRERALKALSAHLIFFLEDGGIDNSFGTRNYKWTYWGSRTSDGCGLGFAMGAQQCPQLGAAAYKNLMLLKACTHRGFLYGGPHLHGIGEPPCIHHTFTHAKVLAAILDGGYDHLLRDGILPRSRMERPLYLPETDTWLYTGQGYTATVTGYDWEYSGLRGGHASGGSLSLLWQKDAGPVLCAGMGCYTMKEPNNMQLPHYPHHECLTPRLEYDDGGVCCSSMYDGECRMVCEETKGGCVLTVNGVLKDIHKFPLCGECSAYKIEYEFQADSIRIKVWTASGASLILPVISQAGEPVRYYGETGLEIQKEKGRVFIEALAGRLKLPLQTERIYSLVPGYQAVKAVLEPEEGKVAISISF